MGKETLYDLRDMLCREMDDVSEKGNLSAGDLDTVHKLTDTIKNIDKILMLEEDEYSNGWEAHSLDNSYRNGRYSRTDGNYSRRGGRRMYSRADGKAEMMRSLESMMEGANGSERDAYRQAMEILRKV